MRKFVLLLIALLIGAAGSVAAFRYAATHNSASADRQNDTDDDFDPGF